MALAEGQHSIPIAYQFSQGDYLALTKAMGPPPWQQILRLLIVWLAMVVVLALVLANRSGNFATGLLDFVTFQAKPAIVYPIIEGVLVLIFLAPVFTRISARRLYKTLSSAGQAITGRLDAAGAHTAMQGVQSSLDWSIVQRLILTEDHLFLVFSKREALVIPKRAFQSPAALDEALALVRSKVPAR
jgi:hypothetical protein